MLIALGLVIAAQAAQAEAIYQLALRENDPPLMVEAKSRPNALREAISEALTRSVRDPTARDESLRVARRLASVYATAWSDPYLVRQVDRFIAASTEWRGRKVRADSMRKAGVTAWSRDGPAGAIPIWKRALASYRSLGDSAGVGGTMDNIGSAMLASGFADSTGPWLQSARRIAVAAGDVRLEANVLGHLADVEAARGRLTAALAGYGEASRLRAKVGDTRGIAADLNNQGLIARELGDPDGARRHFEAALAINRAEERPEVAATNLVNLAAVASQQGDLTRARGHYQDALATWRAREEWAEAASALAGLGRLELRRGDYPAARRALADAVTIYERTGPLGDLLDARATLADALAATGRLQEAITELARADSAAIAGGAGSAIRGEIALGRGDLAYRLNALPDADRHYREASRRFAQSRDPDREAEARHGLALVALARDDTAAAETLLRSAL
ncbi:MAG TPA: tetratricopeptide repeat protein, partial [Gemmatimonadales bacterium]|nr:tetratricopeptide repeat protein [Gemmatimonadales bacterium]